MPQFSIRVKLMAKGREQVEEIRHEIAELLRARGFPESSILDEDWRVTGAADESEAQLGYNGSLDDETEAALDW